MPNADNQDAAVFGYNVNNKMRAAWMDTHRRRNLGALSCQLRVFSLKRENIMKIQVLFVCLWETKQAFSVFMDLANIRRRFLGKPVLQGQLFGRVLRDSRISVMVSSLTPLAEPSFTMRCMSKILVSRA